MIHSKECIKQTQFSVFNESIAGMTRVNKISKHSLENYGNFNIVVK